MLCGDSEPVQPAPAASRISLEAGQGRTVPNNYASLASECAGIGGNTRGRYEHTLNRGANRHNAKEFPHYFDSDRTRMVFALHE